MPTYPCLGPPVASQNHGGCSESQSQPAPEPSQSGQMFSHGAHLVTECVEKVKNHRLSFLFSWRFSCRGVWHYTGNPWCKPSWVARVVGARQGQLWAPLLRDRGAGRQFLFWAPAALGIRDPGCLQKPQAGVCLPFFQPFSLAEVYYVRPWVSPGACQCHPGTWQRRAWWAILRSRAYMHLTSFPGDSAKA